MAVGPFFTFLTGTFFSHSCVDLEKVCILFGLKKKKEKEAVFQSVLSRFMTKAAKPATARDCISDQIQIFIKPFK